LARHNSCDDDDDDDDDDFVDFDHGEIAGEDDMDDYCAKSAAHQMAEYRAAMSALRGGSRGIAQGGTAGAYEDNHFLSRAASASASGVWGGVPSAPLSSHASDDYGMQRAVSLSNEEVKGGQDFEFIQSEAADRAKVEAKRVAEREAQEAQLVTDALQLSAASAEQEATARATELRKLAASRLRPEPSDSKGGDDGGAALGGAVVTVCFRLPPGCGKARIERRFCTSYPLTSKAAFGCSHGRSDNAGGDGDTVQCLLDFLRSREELASVKKWELHLGHGRKGAPSLLGSSSSDADWESVDAGLYHDIESTSSSTSASFSSSNSSSSSSTMALRPVTASSLLSSLDLGPRVLLLVRDADA